MFHGSYLDSDVTFLLKKIEIEEVSVYKKEELLQSGKKHYSEMISSEYVPSKEYLDIFHDSLILNKNKLALDILVLAKEISNVDNPIIISLARAGTPIGVLLNRTLKEVLNKKSIHYSVSIIRDKGLDSNALKYIVDNHGDKNLFFIDGWTGKGSISKELKKSILEFNQKYKTKVSDKLYTIADISGSADFCSTEEDYLIPSAVLNSTVSGLISRTVLNKEFISKNDFHGCKFYSDLIKDDLSLYYIKEIMNEIKKFDPSHINKFILMQNIRSRELSINFLNNISARYKITNLNMIKPGIGETTRVLLRRIPELILLKDTKNPDVKHLIKLAEEKNIKIEILSDMPYRATGIISNISD